MAYDLPAGGRRIVQKARGYVGTWVAGVQTVDHDEFTGATPGTLRRAPGADHPAPAQRQASTRSARFLGVILPRYFRRDSSRSARRIPPGTETSGSPARREPSAIIAVRQLHEQENDG